MKSSSGYSVPKRSGETISQAAVDKIINIAVVSAAAILCAIIDSILKDES